MKKQKIKLPTKTWGTTVSKYGADTNKVGEDDFTSGSVNFRTDVDGNINKRPGGVVYNPSSLFGGGVSDTYEVVWNDGTRWMLVVYDGSLYYTAGNGVFTEIATGYSTLLNFEFATDLNRVYAGNGQVAIVIDKTAVYGGVSYGIPYVGPMGAFAPLTPLTAPSTGTTGGAVPDGAHTYKVTYVYYGFEESNSSPSSGATTVSSTNQTVSLTAVPIGGYGVTARNIYRDNNDGNYLLVGSIDNNTATTFTDTFATTTVPIPVNNLVPVVFNLITCLNNRLWMAMKGTSVLNFSEAGSPNISWGSDYITTNEEDPMTAIYNFESTVVVFNQDSFGLVVGSTSADYAYSEIAPDVGCVDNRSIQVRVVDGVPVLIWLSNAGFYSWNGSSYQYISDSIEDEVNFNIQQGASSINQNFQNTTTQFNDGTLSGSITTANGDIETINPSVTFSQESVWEAATGVNVATVFNSGEMGVPTQGNNFVIANGTLSGTIQTDPSTGYLDLPVSSLFYGNTTPDGGSYSLPANGYEGAGPGSIWQPIIPPVTGTLTGFYLSYTQHGSNVNPSGDYYSAQRVVDSSGNVLWQNNLGNQQNVSQWFYPNVVLTGGQKYYYGAFTTGVLDYMGSVEKGNSLFAGDMSPIYCNGDSPIVGPSAMSCNSLYSGYTFVQSSIPSPGGSWTSPIYDSLSKSVSDAMSLVSSFTYPSVNAQGTACTTGASVVIQGSTTPGFLAVDSNITLTNPNGTTSLSSWTTFNSDEYWRIVVTLSSSDNSVTPSMTSDPVILFNTQGTWTSNVIDCTADVTSYTSLVASISLPTGTSYSLTIATSPDNSTWSSFVPFGTQVVQRYAKVQVVLNTDTGNTVSPMLGNIVFDWAVTGTFISSAIDTGLNPPYGWDVMLSSYQLNGGTIVFSMRSATTSAGLAGSSWTVVVPGQFPTGLPLHEWVQWRAVLSSTANEIPQIFSFTTVWFTVPSVQSIRVASLFYNRTYIVSAAELGQTTNNVVLAFDYEAKWRIWRGLNITSLATFFNLPYYFDTAGRMVKWLDGISVDPGDVNVSMDVRSKAFHMGEIDKTKILREVYVSGLNTGAVYNFYASFDNGSTWVPLLVETQESATQLTTTTDGSRFVHYLIPDFTGSANNQGKTVMIRITESSAYPVEISEMKIAIWMREGTLNRAY